MDCHSGRQRGPVLATRGIAGLRRQGRSKYQLPDPPRRNPGGQFRVADYGPAGRARSLGRATSRRELSAAIGRSSLNRRGAGSAAQAHASVELQDDRLHPRQSPPIDARRNGHPGAAPSPLGRWPPVPPFVRLVLAVIVQRRTDGDVQTRRTMAGRQDDAGDTLDVDLSGIVTATRQLLIDIGRQRRGVVFLAERTNRHRPRWRAIVRLKRRWRPRPFA